MALLKMRMFSYCGPWCLCVPIRTQDSFRSHVAIHATDQTGAVVPKARVEVTATDRMLAAVGKTDSEGSTSLDLPVGAYELMVVSRGFYFAKQRFNVAYTPRQSVHAILQVDACPGPGHPACIAVTPSSSTPQPESAAKRVQATVQDLTGEPISGAQIEALSKGSRIRETTMTDEAGVGKLTLRPGIYIFSVRQQLFRTWSRQMEIGAAAEKQIKVKMDIDCAHVTCDVVVSSDAPSLTEP